MHVDADQYEIHRRADQSIWKRSHTRRRLGHRPALAPDWAQPGTDLSGSTVVVVGGAGGVGEGVVRAVLARGATVVATSRSADRLDDLARRIGHPRLAVRELDLLDPGLDQAATALAEDFGTLRGVVLSVADWGRQGRKPLLELTDAEWDDQLR